MKKLVLVLCLLVSLPVLSKKYNLFGFTGANEKIKTKVRWIKESLTKSGFKVNWFIISEKRSKLYNSILPNSAKKSYHLHGDAIDVFVIDIDGDGIFTQKDLDIVKYHNNLVERRNPSLKGAFGTYTTKSELTKRMIHFDTRGYHLIYNN